MKLNLKRDYEDEELDFVGSEVDSQKSYDSAEEIMPSINQIKPKSEFASRRSTFFNSFKHESLKLITIP